ncbi:uncharacterized protein LOC108042199 [Drosophila rhopaloa]|uniref:peptidylprolyl isomerase n=1 Tax=Drosophila rhopaloa TaxID=1041015 RepID=A0A6P4EH39_DRORH|nr:uncharacterized protein LOC108042199 [Drosophila rhopaloa]
MNSENSELSDSSSKENDSGKSCGCSGSGSKNLDWSDVVENNPYSGSGEVTKPTEYNKPPVGCEERLAYRTKECYFYDTNTRKIFFTLPPDEYIGAIHDGWNVIAGKECKCNCRCVLRCRHILVKHNESDRLSSFRKRQVNRTKEEALYNISQAWNRLKAGEIEFPKLARAISDCCSARYGGDLGPFKLTQMSFCFEQNVLRLKINELSDIFETRSGYHILLRTPANNSERGSSKTKKKHRRFVKISDAIEKKKCKARLMKNKLFPSFLHESQTEVCSLLGQRQRNCDSVKKADSVLKRDSYLPPEDDPMMRLYTQQQLRLKNTIIQKKLDVAMYLGNALKIIETDALGKSVIKLQKVTKYLLIHKENLRPKNLHEVYNEHDKI